MVDELSVKDFVTLYSNELRTEEQLKAKLTASDNKALVDYILELIKDTEEENAEALSELEEEEDGSELEYDWRRRLRHSKS